MKLRDVTLSDRYRFDEDKVLLSGTQALVRILIMQCELDRRAGLKTEGFVSGYRGSPLGGFDTELWKAKPELERASVHFQPGVNEDLAATAVWGSQQIDSLPGKTVDGVFGMWYGKGPGVDRSGDPLKHGNYFGATEHGGALVVFGDDHPGKSSSIAHASEAALAANYFPVLSPSTLEEVVEFGLHGYAMSRFTGLWVALKIVNETAETSATVSVGVDKIDIVTPEQPDAADVGPRGGFVGPQADEVLVVRSRMPRISIYARANRLDRVAVGGAGRLGIVTSGKAYGDLLDALDLLGIDDVRARALGIAVYKIGLIHPLEPQGLSAFAHGREELLFVEEKYAFLEKQAATILYHSESRPRLTGKQAPDGSMLLPADVQIDALIVAEALSNRLEAMDMIDEELVERITMLRKQADRKVLPAAVGRLPYFCSGCPHNSSTKVPEGSHAFSGIGCHVMAIWMDRKTLKPTHMGGEGANWIGLSPFVNVPHVFQNLGDGTYAHSGLLAVRAAVQAGVNITYKVLINDAVAMTGGQPVEGGIGTEEIARQLLAEGVRACVIVSDDVKRTGYAVAGVAVRPREDLDLVQRELRETKGVTVILYEQVCATEKRRRRKRGTAAKTDTRVFINSDVCEGCGDCSVQSNCVSIKPKETALGIKREIDQSSCNVDLSCIKGFCPSFVTVEGGAPRKAAHHNIDGSLFAELPDADRPLVKDQQILIAGAGGTGVVTVGAVLGMAAHLAGHGSANFNMTGLSQKGGAVFSHLRLFVDPDRAASALVTPGRADLVLACDIVAAAAGEAIKLYDSARTRVVANGEPEVTAAFHLNRDFALDHTDLRRALERSTLERSYINATSIARQLLGDTIGANVFVVGYAYQSGWLPLPLEAIKRAIELNGTAVAFNMKALNLGRLAAHNAEALPKAKAAKPTAVDLPDIVADRVERLAQYQSQAWAARYRDVVNRVSGRERSAISGADALSKAAAINLFKLMTYKDEYEVARLYAEGSWRRDIDDTLESGYKLRLHLSPPIISRIDPSGGRPRKHSFGPWIFTVFDVLKRLKGLRGTALDPFAYNAERREERALIEEYILDMEEIASSLSRANHKVAIERAMLPDMIRGFGPVKEKAMADARAKRVMLMDRFRKTDRDGVIAKTPARKPWQADTK
jgi:indolepyruvate ferredoxin oxidoreductase